MIKKVLITIFTLLLCIHSTYALNIPKQDSSYYVNDYSNVISNETRDQLIAMNQASDYTYGGYVVVATFDFVDEDLYDFSYKLFNEWGVGDEENDNGVLLVLDIGNENYCYILGTGIEKICSDYKARDIIDTYMEPDFAIGNYDEALEKTSKAFLDIIATGNWTIEDEVIYNNQYQEDSSFDIFTIIIILFIITSVLPNVLVSRPYTRSFNGPMHRPMYPHMHHRPTFHRTNRPMGGGSFRGGSSMGGRHHSGGSSRGAGGTRK